MALMSALCYALSYIYLNRAQRNGQTSDNGLLPVLVMSSASLVLLWVLRAWILHMPALHAWILHTLPLHASNPHATALHAPPARESLRSPADWSAGWRESAERWKSVGFCVLAGVSWNFLGRMTLYASIRRVGPTRGVVLKSIAPVITVILATLFLHEPIEINDAFGFLLMFASIFLLLLERRLLHQRALTLVTQGILLGLTSACLQGVGHVLRKIGVDFVDPLFGATLDMTAAAVAYLAYLLWTGRLAHHVAFYRHHLMRDVWVAAALSAIGSLTFFTATASAPISNVAMILGMQPIFMPLLSGLLLKGSERFTWLSYLSAMLVAVGVALMMVGSVQAVVAA